MKIALDCANGASYKSAVKVIVDMGAEAFVVHNHPNGININRDCGSTHTKNFSEYVKNINVDLGLTFDGDADRVLAIDEKGNLIDGDKIMFICADFLKEKGLSNQYFLAQGIGIVACHAELDYYAPAVLEDELDIETRILELGKTSLLLEQEVFKGKQKLTRILIKLVFVNKETLRPVRVPEKIHQLMEGNK
jgi:YbgC/YbaW family acyl-CoA thioester hydrolase